MFTPLSLYIGLRYTRAKRRNGFISFISLASMIGIALGVMVLITVLSVMNGFDSHIKERVFSLAPPVTINDVGQQLNWQKAKPLVLRQPSVTQAAPFVRGQGLLRFMSSVQPALVMGVLPQQQAKLNDLAKMMVQGKLSDLQAGKFGIILGEDLANNLGLLKGDKVTLIVPKLDVTPLGVTPQFKRFTVVGIFRAGHGFGFDKSYAYVHLQDAQALYSMGKQISGINVKLTNPYLAQRVRQQLQHVFPSSYVSDWSQQYGPFFNAVAMEKTMMFLILVLIIAIAAFNLVSSLVMVVTDKQAEIAILRTIGATPGMIMRVFMVQGSVVGITGTMIGLALGITLALNVSQLVTWLEYVLHRQLFSSSVYFLDYLPSQLAISDILHVCLTALGLSLLATIYPAWKASRIQPAEALRYE